jgi:integrase/recombinase XerD
LEWLENENIQLDGFTYNDLLMFVKHLRESEIKIRNTNCHLMGVQHYFDYQMQQGEVKHNPVVNLRVKGVSEKLPNEILSKHQLDEIYEIYQPQTPVQKRNKIIIGLYIYQALVAEEVQRIEPCDIDLQKGIIRIKKGVVLQRRVLKLTANQILPLQEYLIEIRPQLLKLKPFESDKLLVTTGDSDHLKEATRELLSVLRKRHPYFKSFKQVRSSVISLWIKEKNIREVQYMAGHNSIMSTQRYVRANLDELKGQLAMFHPLK